MTIYCGHLNCPVIDPHHHTAKGTEFSRMELIEALVKIDTLESKLKIARKALEQTSRHSVHHDMCQLDVNNCVQICPTRIAKDALERMK